MSKVWESENKRKTVKWNKKEENLTDMEGKVWEKGKRVKGGKKREGNLLRRIREENLIYSPQTEEDERREDFS